MMPFDPSMNSRPKPSSMDADIPRSITTYNASTLFERIEWCVEKRSNQTRRWTFFIQGNLEHDAQAACQRIIEVIGLAQIYANQMLMSRSMEDQLPPNWRRSGATSSSSSILPRSKITSTRLILQQSISALGAEQKIGVNPS